jgi:hypothetical protein
MSIATSLRPTVSQTIDVDSGTAANRLLALTGWDAFVPTGYVLVHNASDATCFLSTAATAAATCRGIPPGGTGVFGPYARATAATLYVWGAGVGNALVGYDTVFSEGF